MQDLRTWKRNLFGYVLFTEVRDTYRSKLLFRNSRLIVALPKNLSLLTFRERRLMPKGLDPQNLYSSSIGGRQVAVIRQHGRMVHQST